MNILGISGGFRQAYQDVSACLVKDGEIIAAIEEERLSRVKFSAGKLPYLSVIEVLKIGNITIQDIDLIAFHGSTWDAEIDPRLKAYFENHFGYSPPIKRYHHHDCHAASTFYTSGLEEALVITNDNSGDGISFQVMYGKGRELTLLKRISRPDSLGLFYQIITQYCGFTKDSDEYKVMGLSSYGNRNRFDFQFLIDFVDGELIINREYIFVPEPGAPSMHKDEMVFNAAFISKMGKEKRLNTDDFDSFYKDVAASAQAHLEKLIVKIAQYFMQLHEQKNLCLAGGVSLNCVANQQIMNANFVDSLFVFPASSDAGISVGAAYLAAIENGDILHKIDNVYWGNAFDDIASEAVLKQCQSQYEKVDDVAKKAAQDIAENKVIGWFQGKMEFGPRALGNRSILANATNPKMQDLVNQKIKLRESFRPFCPSVLEEDIDLYFEGKQKSSPYMTITYDVRESAKELIPSVVHVDQTARIQTVNEAQNPLFYQLLKYLKSLTQHGVVMNTSFNISNEPIVATPREALASFYGSGLDVLYLGNFRITK